VQKVIEINPYLLGTMAGGAADCFYWEKLLGLHAKKYEISTGRRISTTEAAKYLSDKVYQYRGKGLSMSTMICGYDKDGPRIYNVTDEGSCVNNNRFVVGSGSTIAAGILESRYDFNMSKYDALDLGRDAIFHAGHRDAASGGVVNLYFMDENGWVKIGKYDLDKIRDEKEQNIRFDMERSS
ncbi:20S proteasome subunit beta 5, partial [Enteropsectra breve]